MANKRLVEYEKGFKIDELFEVKTNGISTANDSELLGFSAFKKNNYSYAYQPLDFRFINYVRKKIQRSRYNVMQHVIKGQNIGLCLMKKPNTTEFSAVFVSNKMIDENFYGSITHFFPLYLFQKHFGKINMNEAIVKAFAEKIVPSFGGLPAGRGGNNPDEPSRLTPPKEILTFIKEIPIQRNFVKNLPYNARFQFLLSAKRKEGILSEILFWKQVHKKKFYKINFDRQKIIGNYIVDFYAQNLGLVIEIDGNSHDFKVEYDEKRQKYLESLGLRVFRINDIDVKKNLDQVMWELEDYVVKEYGIGSRDTPSTPFATPSLRDIPIKEGNEPTPLITEEESFALQIFDYIYAVLHSPTYRTKYKKFLRTDFPRIPYPENVKQFERLAGFGERLRNLHLMENIEPQNDMANFPVAGTNEIENAFTEKNNNYCNCKIWINDTQYFDNVPIEAWHFYIGGYQPAHKWLIDRKGQVLSFYDIMHYQRIICVLKETWMVMGKIKRNL